MEYRPCFVNGKKAIFHRWNYISQIREGMLRGQVSGVVSDTYAIVELSDGSVWHCKPCEIQFIDTETVMQQIESDRSVPQEKAGMTKEKLIEDLRRLTDGKAFNYDYETTHLGADRLLLAYINDETVTEVFNDIPKWYA